MEEVLDNSDENKRGILVAKVLFVMTFLMPYLITWIDNEITSQWLIYSPTWIAGVQYDQFLWGFTPTMLIMFQLWIFYPVIGFLAIKYSRGGYPSTKSFLLRIAFVMLLAALFTIPVIIVYSQYGSNYVPVPITLVVTLLMIPWIKPAQIKTPWDEPVHKELDAFEGKDGSESEI